MAEYQRSGRKLARNHSTQLPRYLISFDAETLPRTTDSSNRKFTHCFRLATATIGRIIGTETKNVKKYRFTSTVEFWQWLKSVTGYNYTTWLVSHNALFDMVVCDFMDKFYKSELVVDWPRRKRTKNPAKQAPATMSANAVIESPPTIIAARIAATHARIVVLDTLNWFPVPLKAMGERCGLPKLDMPDFDAPDEDWFIYCQRDSDILFKTFAELIKWVKDNDFGMFRYTAPSQAMAAYRHRFMDHDILIHDNMEVKALERQGYFGGRTEVFRKGKIREKVYQLDVNSLFPSVMKDGEFPCVLDRYEMREDFLPLEPSIDWSRSVAAVRLTTNESIFPMRTRRCVIYPVGTFETVLCGEELSYAHSSGYIVGVGSWAEYRTAPLFTKWVNELYGKRNLYKASGDNLYADFTKRLLNSLYGKWGEKKPVWVNTPEVRSGLPWSTWIEVDPETQESVQYRMFGWLCQRKGAGEESHKSFVAISALCTARSRARMNRLRWLAEDRNVYYQGVDGLIVNQRGFEQLESGGELHESDLGKLRLVKTATEGEIIGCSDYRLGDKVIIAGRARRIEEMKDGSVLQRKFYAARSLFNNKPLTEITEELQEWERSSIVRKGTVGKDGWIKPFELQETVTT